jgi:thioredoxin 1
MIIDFYSSAFCGSCHATRATLAEAARLVPRASVVERDVVAFAGEAEREGIATTPTVIVRRDDGTEVFRAAGAPPLDAVLRALALAV